MARWGKDIKYHKRYKEVQGYYVTAHPLYQTWANMKCRCYDVDDTNYHNYGGRGIDVCAGWYASFEQFALDMGPKPTPQHTIDRIDNSLGYSKANCRWATKHEQMRNRRKFKTNTSGETGVVLKEGGRFAARYDDKDIRYNLGTFDSLDAATAYRDQFVALLILDPDTAMLMTERRARYDSGTQIRGITIHVDGFMVRKTIAGKRVFIGLADTLEHAVDMKNEFESMAMLDLHSALAHVAARPRSNTRLGCRGISKKGDGFTVRKTITGERIYLGYCATIEEAEGLWKKN